MTAKEEWAFSDCVDGPFTTCGSRGECIAEGNHIAVEQGDETFVISRVLPPKIPEFGIDDIIEQLDERAYENTCENVESWLGDSLSAQQAHDMKTCLNEAFVKFLADSNVTIPWFDVGDPEEIKVVPND